MVLAALLPSLPAAVGTWTALALVDRRLAARALANARQAVDEASRLRRDRRSQEDQLLLLTAAAGRPPAGTLRAGTLGAGVLEAGTLEAGAGPPPRVAPASP